MGHPSKWQMYVTIKNRFFGIGMVSDVYHMERNCKACDRNRKGRKYKQHLVLLPGSGHLDLIDMNLLKSFLRAKNENLFDIDITWRWSNLFQETSKSTTKARDTAALLRGRLIVPRKTFSFLFVGNGPQVGNFIETFSKLVGMKHMTAAAHHG